MQSRRPQGLIREALALQRLCQGNFGGALGLAQSVHRIIVERGISRIAHHELQARQRLGAVLLAFLGDFVAPRAIFQEAGNAPDVKPDNLALKIVEIPLPQFRLSRFPFNRLVIEIFHKKIIHINI